MRKLKLILPMLAFVLAVGMAFAFGNADNPFVPGYVNDPVDGWLPVDVNCTSENFECRVQFVDENGEDIGSPLIVYPERDETSTPLKSASNQPFEIVR